MKTPKRKLQLTINKKNDGNQEMKGPKHGKIDETGAPHVGGNTWAGGTGGRDTAGLGGKGGPYRLDAGHDVHQISDEEKNQVPQHIKDAARTLGKEEFEKRLQEIKMSEYDAKLYNQFHESVQNQVKSLQGLMNNLQSKSTEREWVRHQTTGELDDAKLVEGIIGETSVYKRRMNVIPSSGSTQCKPKRLQLVVDVSGSMYRFNGYDGRLDREMEAVVMVMEAFQEYYEKIHYEIVGHSGESYNLLFVSKENPAVNEKQRLQVIKTMHAHAQFCMAGDNTLEAIAHTIQKVEREATKFDDNIVIVLSDANLSRYRIPAEKLSQILLSSETVNTFVIFIGSLGNQATMLKEALPIGRAFVCMDLQNLPLIIGEIFTSSLLKSDD